MKKYFDIPETEKKGNLIEISTQEMKINISQGYDFFFLVETKSYM